jgi:integrase
MSEVLGLRKSSISNGYITINEVIVRVGKEQVRKEQAKTKTRIRRHEIPEYIQTLIDKTDPNTDELIALNGNTIYKRFSSLLKKNGIQHMSFHDLRHMNASVMAMLRIPEKYAMERGGWKTDKVMKKVYTHTFSDERIKVDTVIDDYFEKALGIKEDVDQKKYHAWLTLFDKPNTDESVTEFGSIPKFV